MTDAPSSITSAADATAGSPAGPKPPFLDPSDAPSINLGPWAMTTVDGLDELIDWLNRVLGGMLLSWTTVDLWRQLFDARGTEALRGEFKPVGLATGDDRGTYLRIAVGSGDIWVPTSPRYGFTSTIEIRGDYVLIMIYTDWEQSVRPVYHTLHRLAPPAGA